MKNNKKYNNKKNDNLKNDLQQMIIACSINTINKNFDLLIENQKLTQSLLDIREFVLHIKESEYSLSDSLYILEVIKEALHDKRGEE